MSERDMMLRRIRSAIGPGVSQREEAVVRAYRGSTSQSSSERVAEFALRVAEYRAVVHRVNVNELSSAVTAACRRRSVRSLIVPDDIPPDWLPDGVEIRKDGPGERITNELLDQSDGVLTGCAVGIAQTGTVVLDGGSLQGRRAITLLPDYHLCIIREEQIVGLVAEALGSVLLTENAGTRPLTLVSGPSATSDIELNRVEGVHGPRTLEIIIVA